MNVAKIHNKILTVIVFTSFLLSLVYSFYWRIRPVVDAKAYDQIALNLVNGFGFKEDSAKSYKFDTAIIRAGPGYEFFLAGFYKVFGHRYEAVWVVQAILHTLSVWLIYLIARRVFEMTSHNGNTVGLVAAALFGFSPDLIEISAMLMTETLYLFLVISMISLFVSTFYQPANVKFAVLLGLVTGLTILTRPPIVLFIPIFLFFYWQRKNYRSLMVFLSAVVLTLMPWVVRNYLIYHQIVLTTLIGQYNLWLGNTLTSTGGQFSADYNPLIAYTSLQGFASLSKQASLEFSYFVLQYPLVFIKLCLLRLMHFFSLIRPMGFWFYQTGLRQAIFVASSALWIAIIFVSGFAGMIKSFGERRQLWSYLIIGALTAPLVLIPTVVQSRYRFQIYPFLAIFGAYFICQLLDNHSVKIKKTLLATTGFFLVVSTADLIISFKVVLDHLAS